jgi:hypothetical protein
LFLLQHFLQKLKKISIELRGGEGRKRVGILIPHPQINPSRGLLSQYNPNIIKNNTKKNTIKKKLNKKL